MATIHTGLSPLYFIMQVHIGRQYRLKHGAKPQYTVERVERRKITRSLHGWKRRDLEPPFVNIIVFTNGMEVNELFFNRHYEAVE